jgi:hypothetical protein
VLRRRKVEAHGDFILGPVSPKEYKDTVAELNGSRTNRIFEFFKIAPPERIGFAKHREAAEKKAAVIAAAEADAEETATSLRAAPQKAGRRGAPAAATAAAEGKARRRAAGELAPVPQEDPRRGRGNWSCRRRDSRRAAARGRAFGRTLGRTSGEGWAGDRRAATCSPQPAGEGQ